MKAKTTTYTFYPSGEAIAEYHILACITDSSISYEHQLDAILEALREASRGRTVHFRRFFLSDAANQFPQLQQALEKLPPVPTSVVQQEPLDGTKIALWMYCTSPMALSGGAPASN